MKKTTISNLKNNLSQFLRFVKQGESVVVLDRGNAVAEILPRTKKSSNSEELLSRLEACGIVRRGDLRKFKNYPYPMEKSKTGVLEALLDERRSGR